MVPTGALSGRRIVVTAPGRLAARLRDLGADVVECPVIAVEPVDHPDVDVTGYDWVAFSSANAVEHFRAGLVRSTRINPARKVAAVGPATAAALEDRGITVDLVPGEAVAEALVDAFPRGPGRVLLPQAESARPTLAAGLREKGWDVDVVVAYRTVAVPLNDEQRAAASTADSITFTSSSTVENYLDTGGPVPPNVVCIGPVTAATARGRGVAVTTVAEPHTVDGVVGALRAS